MKSFKLVLADGFTISPLGCLTWIELPEYKLLMEILKLVTEASTSKFICLVPVKPFKFRIGSEVASERSTKKPIVSSMLDVLTLRMSPSDT